MHIGVLGRPVRPPRWTSHRTRSQGLIKPAVILAGLIAIVVAENILAGHVFHAPREVSTAVTGPVTLRPPSVPEVSPIGNTIATATVEAPQASRARYDYPKVDPPVPVTAVVRHTLPPKLKHATAWLPTLEKHHPTLTAQSGPRRSQAVTLPPS
jgi:hypothetical protein